MRNQGWQRWLARALLVSAVALVCARVLLVQGTVFPARIASGSMAPTLLGVHRCYRCQACQFEFTCGSESFPQASVACPNCGDESTLATEPELRKGTRVLLDRWQYQWQAPRRGDVVAFQNPNTEATLEIKRVTGLPGETISIRQGDIFVNNKRWRKSFSAYQEVAIPVHDNRFRAPEETPRWRGEPKSRWQTTSEGYRLSEPQTGSKHAASLDWLTYHHRACIPNLVPPPPAGTDSIVLDYCAYNQALSRSHLAAVSDLMLLLEVQLESEGRFLIATASDRRGPRLELNTASMQATVYQADTKLGSAPLPLLRVAPFEVAFGFLDGQVVLAVNQLELMRLPLPSGTKSPFLKNTMPFAIASTSFPVTITQVRITRDIHYLHPHDPRAAWQAEPLGPNQYLLLGDNPPLSLDSRTWPQCGIYRKNLFARVIFPRDGNR